MSEESMQEKTQAPTPKRRQDAARKGQVPRSPEVTTAFLLMAGAGAVGLVGGTASRTVVDLFGRSVVGVTAMPVGMDGAVEHVEAAAGLALAAVAPIVLILSGTALAISVLQARGVLTLTPLKPQWERLDPLKKAKQIWGVKAVAELLKSLLKLGLIGVVVWITLRSMIDDVGSLSQTSPMALLVLLRRYTVRVLLAAGAAYLVVAALDYAYQVWQHEKQLRMTREEVKRELKESEGDQVVKVRRRTMARQLAHRRMMLSVSEADVVVTNPTHVAVALKYDPDVAPAPIVLAMGERKVAERIKALAAEEGIPTVENKPLARALLATARVGQAIPVEFFVAVAEVLAFVYKHRSGAGTYGVGR